MPADDSFADLKTRLRGGDPSAAAEIFHRFQHRLIALAHSRLNALLRAKVAPESVVQSAFDSFFRGERAGKFVLSDWNSLWGLLAQITVWKCGNRNEHFLPACRDVRR